jgi:hypothetical protein
MVALPSTLWALPLAMRALLLKLRAWTPIVRTPPMTEGAFAAEREGSTPVVGAFRWLSGPGR